VHCFNSQFRKASFTNGKVRISLTQIFCSFAKNENDPRQFCQLNNDLFITPEGKIKPCRHDAREFDLKPYLTDNKSNEEVIAVIKEATNYLTTSNSCVCSMKGE
jgi:molybdenum cofactor biosynthesis enzyme MoaA